MSPFVRLMYVVSKRISSAVSPLGVPQIAECWGRFSSWIVILLFDDWMDWIVPVWVCGVV